jgi:hypothetical protein
MKKAVFFLMVFVVAFFNQACCQEASAFPKGEISTANNHTGTIWLSELSKADSMLN